MNVNFDNSMINFSFGLVGTVAMGLIALFLGKFIKNKVSWIKRFGIPAPVIGGLIFALFHLILHTTKTGSIQYDTTIQSPMMLIFFTSIGLSSSLPALKKGGLLLLGFWILSGVMTLMQTVIGVTIAKVTGINALFGVLAGSVSMSGGHGAAGAFGKELADLGLVGAESAAMASATFGLIAGGLIGAPLAIRLIRRNKLVAENVVGKDEVSINNDSSTVSPITSDMILKHLGITLIIIILGTLLTQNLSKLMGDLILPSYVGSMFLAIIFNNLNLKYKWVTLNRKLINIMGVTALSIFLSMALITLRLWEIADLALPLMVILGFQVAFMIVFTTQVLFRFMGKNYDAAVMVAGMCGSGLGATPNAMLNMGEVSERHGYTLNPYLVVTLTGAFLIDIFQMPIIISAINLFK